MSRLMLRIKAYCIDFQFKTGGIIFVLLFHEAGGEPSLLDRAVRDKLDPEAVRRGLDVFRHLVATEGPNEVSTICVSLNITLSVETTSSRRALRFKAC